MKFGLLGEHLPHSYSPQIHALLGSYSYELFEVAPEQLSRFMTQGDFDGLNVTIPYKKDVIPFLSELSARAQQLGSVNTIVRRADGSLFGDNTDYGGFRSLLRTSGISARGRKALVLGSGGASVTAVQVLRDMGASSVTVISRSGPDNYDNLERHADCEILVNTTPVGMYPNNGAAPVDLCSFPMCRGVVDIIYNPEKTALLLQAQELGIPTAGGLHMLVAQAKYAADLFSGKRQSDSIIAAAEQKIRKDMKNIVLIGLPGCGKTVVGRRMANMLGREWVDLDEEIVAAAGKTIPQIFAEEGEEAFRRLETACAAKICSRSGCIISAGGGIVTRPENRNLLRQNSTVVLLLRDLGSLAKKGRPLSAVYSAEELARVRMPLYLEWADVQILNIGIAQTARQLISFLGLKRRAK